MQMPKDKVQITKWPKEKAQNDKQQSTKHTYKTKDRVTRTPLTTGDEFRCLLYMSHPSCYSCYKPGDKS